MCIGVEVSHRIDDEPDVIAVVIGGARRRLHTHASRDSGQEDLCRTAPAQDLLKGGPIESAYLQLGHRVIARLPIQLRNELRPVGRR
jgi:hypothetical protein